MPPGLLHLWGEEAAGWNTYIYVGPSGISVYRVAGEILIHSEVGAPSPEVQYVVTTSYYDLLAENCASS